MNRTAIAYFLGNILLLEALFLLPALGIALWERDGAALLAFSASVLLSAGLSLLSRLFRGDRSVTHREGYAIVSLSWIVISLVGALPFWLSGYIPGFLDALFESVSGFTTTGASVVAQVESLPMSLLYWRCFTNWLGGMGILVFVLAVAPSSNGKGDSLHVLRAEIPGPSVGKLAPTLRRSARMLYIIYVVLTVLEMVLLLLGDMPLFDAVVTAFASAGTGGFGVHSASAAAYDSPYLQLVIALFLILFGVNFNLYYLLLVGKVSQALRGEEIRVYLGLIAAGTLLVAWNIRPGCQSLLQALHHSFFQVSSMITTTAFFTADYTLWPCFSQCVLLCLMMVGSCGGSTGGGIKVSRLVLLWKSVRSSLQRMLHPHSVKVIKMDAKPVDPVVMESTQSFLVVYFLTIFLSLFLLALDDFDFETTFSAVFSCINNIGLGLGQVGPRGSFALFSPLSKLVLIADMFLGRLEIFPMLLLFAPSVWRGRPAHLR